MWTALRTILERQPGIEVTVQRAGATITVADTLELWQRDETFRGFFIELLADAPFDAFRWETPAVTSATLEHAFRFVIVDSPEIARAPDEAPFADQFSGAAGSEVVTFTNLGGDAVLVVPTPRAAPDAYPHLAAFCRAAPLSQRHALWQAVGAAMTRRVGTRPVWLSTAGGGVSWLHVRLDDHPKYYRHGPYRAVPA